MNKLQKRVVTILAAGTLFLNAALPVFASTTGIISGNSADSENKIDINQNSSTGVVQTNDAHISNNVNMTADTGNNEAERNTGGDVSIKTGDAEANAGITNNANYNAAEVGCCDTGGADILISGNGDGSKNTVDLDVKKDSGTFVTQTNDADVDNDVDANAKTGDNKAERNVGGDVSIDTGSATVGVTLATSANANFAKVGGDGEGGEGGMLSARILGNGADTKNKIDLDIDRSILVDQTNDAHVDNDVDAKAKTGDNEAERNTGGSVSIETGDANVEVGIDNMANFNWADVNCGCLLGEDWYKIIGNGDKSKNDIIADLGGEDWVTQGNRTASGELDNDVDVAAKTGDNEVEKSTGGVDGGDPMIDTGNAGIDLTIENTANSNVKGELPGDIELPEMPHFNFNFSIDLSEFLNWLAAHQNA